MNSSKILKLIRVWVNLCLQEFFLELKVKGESPVDEGPLLIAANHPNNLFDPLLITYAYQQDIWYLAKSTLFKGILISKLLRFIRMLPIYRRQDTNFDSTKNDQTFKAVIKELSVKETVLIFPEGVSNIEKKLSPIKTGAARIALQAESENNFSLGLKIQLVGLTYSSFGGFKCSASINFSKTIELKNYQQKYQQNEAETVKELTDLIEKELKKLTVEVFSNDDNQLLEDIAWLYRSAGRIEDPHEAYNLIANNLKLNFENRSNLATRISLKTLELKKLADSLALADIPLTLRNFSTTHLFLFGPFILLGVLVNFLPYKFLFIVSVFLKKSSLSGTGSAFIMAFGIFPLWNCFIIYTIFKFFQITVLNNIFSFIMRNILMLIIAVLANTYWHSLKLMAFQIISKVGYRKYSKLIEERDALIAEMEIIRKI